MALFKISKGLSDNLPQTLTEGYCWYTCNDSKFYIDHKDENGVLVRKALNSEYAEKLRYVEDGDIIELNPSEIVTKTELSQALTGKANASHNHDDIYYTETEIDVKIENAINEAKADASDKDIVVLFETQKSIDAINTGLDNKVDKVNGKGLSTNDLTNDLKQNYDTAYTHSTSSHAPSNAEKNIIVGIQKNGTDLTVNSSTRKINITVPTTAAEVGAASSNHNHDDKYDTKGAASTALDEAKGYVDSKIVGKKTTEGGEIFNAYDWNSAGLSAHAEGVDTHATGFVSHAEGIGTDAAGDYSHAEGNCAKSISHNTHSEGFDTKAGGKGFKITAVSDSGNGIGVYTLSSVTGLEIGMEYSVRISEARYKAGAITAINGNKVTVNGFPKVALETDADSTYSIENYLTIVGRPDLGDTDVGFHAHAEGEKTIAQDRASHAEGKDTMAIGQFGHAEGRQTVAGYAAHAEGRQTEALGTMSHAEGFKSQAFGNNSHAEGRYTTADGLGAHAEGVGDSDTSRTIAIGDGSHAEGHNAIAYSKYSHAEGDGTKAGEFANGANEQNYRAAHAEGVRTQASYVGAHSEGIDTKAEGQASHAEGQGSIASGHDAHAEGYRTDATGSHSHAQGYDTTASGEASHSEGLYTSASGRGSHAEGFYTIANGEFQHVSGKFNVGDTTSLVIVGNGTSDSNRKNAYKLDASGNAWFAGNIKVGGTDSSGADAQEIATKIYVDNAANKVKNDLLNGAGAAYDTLKELGDLIDDNKDAIEALEDIASSKADKTHSHAIADVSGLQSALDGKAASSHGTHVSYSTTAPVMDGTASVGSASTVARSDHKHPTDTSRAAQTDLDTHTANTTVHITSTERTNWNAAKTHADSAHAPSNAEKNQNAFSNIAVSGQTTVAADSATDTVTFAGSNVSITTDATNDKVTFSVANGTTSAKGVVQLTNSTSSTSTTTAATPNSVKSAYDLANQAKTAAENAQTTADGKADAGHNHTVANITDLTATATELNYMDGATSNVQAQLDGKAASSHTHNYAGSSSAGGAATSANKVNSSLIVKLNGGTTEGTNMFTFNGSAAKSVNITASAIGAAASSHNHDDRYYTELEIDTKLSGKANSSHGNHVPATQTASNKVFLRNDNTWATVTPENIGAAASSHNHTVSNITDLTVTAAELNYIDGVESNVQAQLDGKAALSHNHAATEITSGTLSSDRLPTVPIAKGGTGATTAAGALTNLGLTATAAELNKLDGVTATTAELNYVDGVTSNIQTQLNGKAAYSHTHSYLPLSGGTLTGELKIDGYDDDYLKLKADIETVSIASVDGTNNATLVIGVNKAVKEKLTLTTYTNGTLKQYKIYGEHNKPTAADIGAASTDSIVTYSLSKSGSKIVLTGSDGSTSMVDDATSSGSGGTDGMERELILNVGGIGPVTPNAPKTQMYTVNLYHKNFTIEKTIFVDWMQVYLQNDNGGVMYLVDYGRGNSQYTDGTSQGNLNTYLHCWVDGNGLVVFCLTGDTSNWEFQSICGYY